MFTRQLYDTNTYMNDLDEWKKPGKYYLLPDSRYLKNQTCFENSTELHGINKQYNINQKNDMVNMESDLFNLSRKNTQNPFQKFPYVQTKYLNEQTIPICETSFNMKYPKLEGSQYNRGKSIIVPRFESLCLNPQKFTRIRSNNVIGMNTRLFQRDQVTQISPSNLK
jgi:hypothetical protein